MKHYWQPNIDTWIPETVNINNTTVHPISYAYAPNEGEESKHVNGLGNVKLLDLKNKIKEILHDLLTCAKSDNSQDVEKLYHNIVTTPELQNIVKQYHDFYKQTLVKR